MLLDELDRELASIPGGRVECPQCGSAMVVKTAHRGRNAGGKFWGCPNWPRCHGIRSYPVKPAGS